MDTPPREQYGKSTSSQVLLPTISQSQDPRISGGDGLRSSSNNLGSGNGLLSPINKGQENNLRDSLISVTDLTQRNV